MKKNKLFKIITIILISTLLFLSFSHNVFALNFNIKTKFENTSDKSNTTNTLSNIIGNTINIFQIVGAGCAIIMLIATGIKWIGASPSGKAQIKKTSTYYIIGAIFIFAAIGLLQIVKNFSNGSFGSIN